MNSFDEYLRFLGTDDPEVKSLLRLAKLDPTTKKNVKVRLMQMVEERGGDIADLFPFTQTPPSRDYHASFCIGRGFQGTGPGYDYLVSLDSFTQSGGIFGVPGVGKTKLAQVISMGIIKTGGRMIVFDPMHEYHQLIHAFPSEVAVFELGKTDRENPLQPPGNMSPRDWIGIQKNILREQFLKDGSTNLHEDIMTRAYQSYGVLDGGSNYPTLRQIRAGSLEKTDFKLGTRYYGYKESLTDRIRTLASVPTFDVKQGYDLAEILRSKKVVILRLGNYSSDIKLFYVNLKLEKLRQCLIEHPGEFGRVVILLDEAYELTSPLLKKRVEITEPLIYRCVRQFRRHNASFLLIDHYAAGIPEPIWACFGNLFILRQSETKSIWSIATARNLDDDQSDFLSKIPFQHVVHCPSEDEPRLVKVMDLNLPHVSEQELDDCMQPILEKFRYVPDDGSPAPVVETPTQVEPRRATLKKIDRQVLEHALEHPFQTVSKISELMGNFSPVIAKNSLKKLEEQGYVESFMANLGMGRPKKLHLGTEKGSDLLGEDYKKIRPKGKGSLLHRAAQRLISETLGGSEQGILVEYGLADVAEVLGDGKLRAYELELHPDSGDIANQITNDFEAGFSEVVVLAINKEQLEKVKNRVHKKLQTNLHQSNGVDTADKLNHVRFDLLKNYINLD